MAPSELQLEEALIEAAVNLFEADADNVTVNMVRKNAADKLSLGQDFFTSTRWKAKSKDMIKSYVTQLHEGIIPMPKKSKDTKSTNKRRPTARSTEELSSEPKRRKQAASARTKPKKEESENGENEEDLSDEEESAPKAKIKRRAKLKKMDSDDDGNALVTKAPKLKVADSDEEDEKEAKGQAKQKSKSSTTNSDSERGMKSVVVRKHEKYVRDEMKREDSPEESKGKSKKSVASDGEMPKGAKEEESVEEEKLALKEEAPQIDESEEYSDVIDEPPKPKRAKQEKTEKKERKIKDKKTTTVPASDDPNEAEMKKLQYQLTRCGIRKLWHNELKQYGSNSKAKIRHLKKMLEDAGMTGRFSEARAKEIKEERELLADVEEAQKMNQLWGMASEGRASRSKVKKNVKEEPENEGEVETKADGDDEDDEDDEDKVFAARRRAQADLAFLGDESESD